MTSTVTVNLPLGKIVTVEAILECPIGDFNGYCFITYNGQTTSYLLSEATPNDYGQVVCSVELVVHSSDTATISLSNAEGVYVQGVAVACE